MAAVEDITSGDKSLIRPFFGGLPGTLKLFQPIADTGRPCPNTVKASWVFIKVVVYTYVVLFGGMGVGLACILHYGNGTLIFDLDVKDGLGVWDRNGIYISVFIGITAPIGYYFAFRYTYRRIVLRQAGKYFFSGDSQRN